MTKIDEKEIMNGLATSPDFLATLSEFLCRTDTGSVDFGQMGLWFFSKGYLSCLDYMDKKDRSLSFNFKAYKDCGL